MLSPSGQWTTPPHAASADFTVVSITVDDAEVIVQCRVDLVGHRDILEILCRYELDQQIS